MAVALTYSVIHKSVISGKFYKYVYSDRCRISHMYCRNFDDFKKIIQHWNSYYNEEKYTFFGDCGIEKSFDEIMEAHDYQLKFIINCPFTDVEYIK